MDSLVLAVGSAFWLGILTSISPCPLASNIAAVTFIGRRVDNPAKVLLAGVLYTLGRTLSYFVVAFIAVKSLVSVPAVSVPAPVDGLPIGVQVVGVRVAERGVLDVAAALERAWRPA